MRDPTFVLQRTVSGPNGTLGVLSDGQFRCFTLEPPATGPHPAIPSGTYEIQMLHSPRFNRLVPTLIDVPGRSHILIHPGNTGEDTEGCILLGLQQAPRSVLHSRDAVHGFVIRLGVHERLDGAVFLKIESPAVIPEPPTLVA
jgi:hypothetical protein